MNDLAANFRKMPGPLKLLTLLSLASILLIAVTLVPGGAVVGQKNVRLKEWWINGSGLIFSATVCLFFSAGIFLLKARGLGRLVYMAGFAGIYCGAYVIEMINDVSYPREEYFQDLLFAALQIAVLSAYFYLSRRVKNYFVSESAE